MARKDGPGKEVGTRDRGTKERARARPKAKEAKGLARTKRSRWISFGRPRRANGEVIGDMMIGRTEAMDHSEL